MLGAAGRLRALDGLRGVAAVVVMLHHSSLIAEPYLHVGGSPDVWWYLSSTPLRLFTAGHEAVLVFFVLSGVVLTRSVLGRGVRWSRYYAARLVRLYLPVWVAILFSTALILLVPRDPSTLAVGGGWTTLGTATSVSPLQMVYEASLTDVAPRIDNVLWSLVWEVVFSAALPLAVLLARVIRGNASAIVVALLALGTDLLGQTLHIDALVYLPVFVFGVVIAARLDDIAPSRLPWGVWWAALAVSLALLIVVEVEPSPMPGLFDALSGLGAAGIVLCVAVAPSVARPFELAVPRFLGRISFSLYLVHAPVLVALVYLLGNADWYLALAIGIPMALALAVLFWRFVESPSHRLAKAAGNAAAELGDLRRRRREERRVHAAQAPVETAGPSADYAAR